MRQKYTDEQVKRFQDCMTKSHGKTNNRLSMDLIELTDASNEDVVRLCSKLGKDGFYCSWDMPGHYTEQRRDAEERERNAEAVLGHKLKTYRDYRWLFRNTPIELIPDVKNTEEAYLGVQRTRTTVDVVENNIKYLIGNKVDAIVNPYNVSVLMTYRNILKTMFDNKEPNIHITEGMKNSLTKDLDWTAKQLGLRVGDDARSRYYDNGISDNKYGRATNCAWYLEKASKKTVKQVYELAGQVRAIEIIMHANIDENAPNFDNNDGSLALNYVRVSDWQDNDRVQKTIENTYRLLRDYEMLLDMGIGIYRNDHRPYPRRAEINRITSRLRAMYKKFVSAKTVEQRKDIRELLLAQLKVISNDFANSTYMFAPLKCIDEQDELFAQSKKPVKTKGVENGTKLDLNELAKQLK